MTKLREYFTFKDFGKDHFLIDYVKKLNSARVQFVQSGCSEFALNGYIAQRFFECLAIGPVLTNYHPDLKLLGLEENVDYMYFIDEEDMVKKMRILINDPALRNRIRISGRKKAILLHTYDQRLVAIISKIREHSAIN